MGIHSLCGKELGEAPLDINTFHRIGIVTAPELCEVLQCFIIAPRTATGAKHHRYIGIIRLYTFQNVVYTTHMVYIKLSLFVFQISGIDIGDGAVAIPLEESDIGIFLHNVFYNTIYIILHFRVAKIQYQLIAVIIRFAVRQLNGPIRMFLKEFALGVHHFRFNPDAELHIRIFGSFY